MNTAAIGLVNAPNEIWQFPAHPPLNPVLVAGGSMELTLSPKVANRK